METMIKATGRVVHVTERTDNGYVIGMNEWGMRVALPVYVTTLTDAQVRTLKEHA